MVINRNKCAICNKSNLENIFKIENIPVNLSCVETNKKYKYSTLSFSICKNCNTIQLDKLIQLKILYGLSHNFTSVGKIWENYFKLLISNIQLLIRDKVILEIGDPSGKIATNCNYYKKWYIVEPNKNNTIEFNDKIIFIESFFDNNFALKDNVDIIIHSHLFEHIYEPNKFLKKCYEILNKNGEMIFGVPNMEFLANKSLCLFLGVFFEHTIFLNKENIIYLLEKNGFGIINILNYENHSLIFHAKKNKVNSIINIKINNYYEMFFTIIDEYKLFIKNCNTFIDNNSSKTFFLFGASYNSQFLLTLGLNGNKLKGILDNSKEKQNKYLYGTDLKIYSPDVLIKDCVVILKNGYYVKEIYEQIKKIDEDIVIII
jgi:SAM-dependent methyltransferase